MWHIVRGNPFSQRKKSTIWDRKNCSIIKVLEGHMGEKVVLVKPFQRHMGGMGLQGPWKHMGCTTK
jgi:hypothetical protein